MRGNKHGSATSPRFFEQSEQRFASGNIKPDKGFIDQQERKGAD